MPEDRASIAAPFAATLALFLRPSAWAALAFDIGLVLLQGWTMGGVVSWMRDGGMRIGSFAILMTFASTAIGVLIHGLEGLALILLAFGFRGSVQVIGRAGFWLFIACWLGWVLTLAVLYAVASSLSNALVSGLYWEDAASVFRWMTALVGLLFAGIKIAMLPLQVQILALAGPRGPSFASIGAQLGRNPLGYYGGYALLLALNLVITFLGGNPTVTGIARAIVGLASLAFVAAVYRAMLATPGENEEAFR